MNIKQLEEIKDKIELLKQNRAKAQGTIEKIEKDWHDNFGVSTIEEAKNKLMELQANLEQKEERLETLTEKLEAVTNWEDV